MFVFKDDEGVHGVPDWFVGWVRLGTLAAHGSLAGPLNTQTLIAVSVPTKSLAAAAIAFGFTRHRYTQPSQPACPPELVLDQHDVQPGARIWLRLPEGVAVGAYLGGLPTRMGLSKSGWFLTEKVSEIRLAPDWVDLADGRREVGSPEERSFVQSMLPRANPEDFLTSWDLGLVIVGSPIRIHDELHEKIAFNGGFHSYGSIGQIIRPFNDFAPTGWRSVIMSAWDDHAVWEGWPMPPQLAILNGAYAVSRWLPECPAPLVVAVLDRTEPGVETAQTVLMQERSFSIPIREGGISWRPPGGCELIAFRRPR